MKFAPVPLDLPLESEEGGRARRRRPHQPHGSRTGLLTAVPAVVAPVSVALVIRPVMVIRVARIAGLAPVAHRACGEPDDRPLGKTSGGVHLDDYIIGIDSNERG